MGIYCFKWDVLRKYLMQDEEDPKSSNDFGKNVIPAMLADGCKMYAWRFDGYWKDVGTIESLWEANMDLLGTEPGFLPPGKGQDLLPKLCHARQLYRRQGKDPR